MRISDWSSYVCSSDLPPAAHGVMDHLEIDAGLEQIEVQHAAARRVLPDPRRPLATHQVGRPEPCPDVELAPALEFPRYAGEPERRRLRFPQQRSPLAFPPPLPPLPPAARREVRRDAPSAAEGAAPGPERQRGG